MPPGYVPLLVFAALALAVPLGTLIAAGLVRPRVPIATKAEPYECGIPPAQSARGRFSVRFYLVAILFVLFDVETVFLFPWAVRHRQLGWFGLAEAGVFLLILVVGYWWAYKKGALEWV